MRNKNYSALLAVVFAITSVFFAGCKKDELVETPKNATNVTNIVKEGYIVLGSVPREILLSSVIFIDGSYYSPIDRTNPITGDFTLELYNVKDDKLVASSSVSYNTSYEAQEFKVPFGRYYLKIKNTENSVYRNTPCPPNPTTKIAYFDVNTEDKPTPSEFLFIIIEKLQ